MMNTLPKIALAFSLIATIGFQSCDKVKNVIKTPDITLTGAGTDVIIPITVDTLNEGTMSTDTVKYNIDSAIKANTGGVVGYSNISSVKITKVTLTLSDADANNSFGNFVTAAATFNTDAQGGTLQPYNIADIENNPATMSSSIDLPLQSKDTNLKSYFASNATVSITYALKGKLRHATTKQLHCHVDVTYSIAF